MIRSGSPVRAQAIGALNEEEAEEGEEEPGDLEPQDASSMNKGSPDGLAESSSLPFLFRRWRFCCARRRFCRAQPRFCRTQHRSARPAAASPRSALRVRAAFPMPLACPRPAFDQRDPVSYKKSTHFRRRAHRFRLQPSGIRSKVKEVSSGARARCGAETGRNFESKNAQAGPETRRGHSCERLRVGIHRRRGPGHSQAGL